MFDYTLLVEASLTIEPSKRPDAAELTPTGFFWTVTIRARTQDEAEELARSIIESEEGTAATVVEIELTERSDAPGIQPSNADNPLVVRRMGRSFFTDDS